MPSFITVTGREAATNTDLLANTRLLSCPAGSKLKIELQADLNTAAANYTVTLSLPGQGQAPWQDIIVPSSNSSLTGVMDERTTLSAVFDILAAGHVTISVTETGTTLLDWRVTSMVA